MELRPLNDYEWRVLTAVVASRLETFKVNPGAINRLKREKLITVETVECARYMIATEAGRLKLRNRAT
jgi:hypothetical protein